MDYTRKERESINAAWNAAMSLTEETDMGTSSMMLHDALSYERHPSRRGGPTCAKAVILRALHDAFTAESMATIDSLWGYSRGCALGAILGAHWRDPRWLDGDERRQERVARVVTLINKAVSDQHGAVERTLARLGFPPKRDA